MPCFSAYYSTAWPVIAGCTKVSPGCDRCFALARVFQLANRPGERQKFYAALVDAQRNWTGQVALDTSVLYDPFTWSGNRRVGVAFFGDLFNPLLSDSDRDQVFAVMALTPQHEYLTLTKRPKGMLRYMSDPATPQRIYQAALAIPDRPAISGAGFPWPLANHWPGVSAELQPLFDSRAALLLETPARGPRWVSIEPMLGAIDVSVVLAKRPRPDWIVLGAEFGPGARPLPAGGASAVKLACLEAGVPFLWQNRGLGVPRG